ncbi:monovalent cation/H(+) antiporter subunit G [uncultured Methanoregula sp.]|uniref:monovalent cation/H(+) antiporter subunit G n=1 Tax=uncultured Methanoregula sp. TaxID=1005933 RepID=UPI002AAAA53E|nr:monovalent cation/H(+) antiporter subunit G [uncultured Methanoregula sp.]
MIFPADILIWLLLAVGIGFCALGLFGLFIFPDIRSRMYTAVRATLIGVTAITVSALIYAVSLFSETNENQYFMLALEILFLCVVIVIPTVLLSQEIQNLIRARN